MDEHSKYRIEIATQLAQSLNKITPNPLRSFVLYGSSILGTAKEDSDIDIMVLLDYSERNFMQQASLLVRELQQQTQLKIAVNAQTVSNFIKEIVEGDPYFIHIGLKGKCLLNSDVFRGVKALVDTNNLPSQQQLIDKNARDTHERVKQLFLGSLVSLNSGIRVTILKYLDLQLVKEMELSSWDDYQDKIQREAYAPTIRKYLSQYADTVEAFFKLSDKIKPLGFDLEELDTLPECNFTELLHCIEFILADTTIKNS